MSNQFILCVFAVFLITGCQKNNSNTFAGNIMTIDYKIVVEHYLSSQQKIEVENAIQSCFHEINVIYNKWNPDSELGRINNLEANIKSNLSSQLKKLLDITDFVVNITDGKFDPTIEPLHQLWKAHLTQGKVPQQNQINNFTSAVGWHNIHYGDGFIYKDHHLTAIDLGGIAKGYGVDIIIEKLIKLGYANLYVEWGGEIRTSGHHFNNKPWTIFISRLADTNPANALSTILLDNMAIATSGDYLQNWTIMNEKNDVITYTHIIDAKTKTPLTIKSNSIAAVSVRAPTCALADGLATAAMLFPTIQELNDWVKKISYVEPNITFWVVKREG